MICGGSLPYRVMTETKKLSANSQMYYESETIVNGMCSEELVNGS